MSKITANVRIAEPNNVQVEITLRMSLADAKALREQMADGQSASRWPTWRVRDILHTAIGRASAYFEETAEVES